MHLGLLEEDLVGIQLGHVVHAHVGQGCIEILAGTQILMLLKHHLHVNLGQIVHDVWLLLVYLGGLEAVEGLLADLGDLSKSFNFNDLEGWKT